MTTQDLSLGWQDPIETESEYERKKNAVLEAFEAKLKPLAKKLWFVPYLIALYRFMMDGDAHWTRKAVAVSALLYFITPIDAIPDIAPVVGYLDDLGVALAAIRYLGRQLDPYLPV